MDEKKDSLNLQVRFSRTNFIIAILMLLFYIFLSIFGSGISKLSYILAFIVVLLLLADYLLGRVGYFGSILLIKISRIIICTSIAICMVSGREQALAGGEEDDKKLFVIAMVFLIMSILYCIICIEHMFMFDVTEVYYQINAVAEMVIPLTTIVLLKYALSEDIASSDVLLVLMFIVAIIGMFFSVLKRISEVLKEFFEKLFRQERIAINSKEESNNLKLYQSKLVRANEQLSKQKVQLEIANTTIMRSNTEMKMQHMLVKHINSELDSHKIIEFITKGMIEHLNLDLCAVIIRQNDSIDESEEILCSVNSTKDSALGSNVTQSIRDSEFIKMYGILPNATYVADNKVPDSKYDFLIGSNIGSLLIYPMSVQKNTTGVLVAGKNSYGYFKENISFYETIVEQIILALRNAFMYSKVQDMATKDALTTIYNRRYFNSIFPEFIHKAVTEKKDMTVVLFDIDRFKVVNDNYGHIFGDKVIKYCGKIAGEYAKKYDGFAVRYGGEEFVISFFDKKTQEVYMLIKQMHDEIKEHEFICDGQTVKINVSIGITSYPDVCSNINELLNRADLSMYSSKKNGRGRITIDSPEIE